LPLYRNKVADSIFSIPSSLCLCTIDSEIGEFLGGKVCDVFAKFRIDDNVDLCKIP